MAILVEAGVWRAGVKGIGAGAGNIPHSKHIDVLQGDCRQGRGCRRCVGAEAGLGRSEQLAGVVPNIKQLGMDTTPQKLRSPSLGLTSAEDTRWSSPRNKGS